MILSFLGGAVFLGFAYFAFSNLKDVFDAIQHSLPRSVFFWGKLLITIGLVVVLTFLGKHIYRAWVAFNSDQKIVYTGLVTGKRTESGNQNESHHATLDGVEFKLDKEEYLKISEGDQAEFHCAFPGDVFRAVQIDAPKRGKQKKTNIVNVSIDGNTFTVDLNKSITARIGIFIVGIFIALIFTLGSLIMWWIASYPPAALLFKGSAVEMEITEARVESSPYKRGISYRDIVHISPPQLAKPSDDEEEEPAPRKKFSLEARPEAFDVHTEADAKKALQNYPVGKRITAYTVDTELGPFYALRYSLKSLISMITGVLTALAIAGGAGYLAFRRRDEK